MSAAPPRSKPAVEKPSPVQRRRRLPELNPSWPCDTQASSKPAGSCPGSIQASCQLPELHPSWPTTTQARSKPAVKCPSSIHPKPLVKHPTSIQAWYQLPELHPGQPSAAPRSRSAMLHASPIKASRPCPSSTQTSRQLPEPDPSWLSNIQARSKRAVCCPISIQASCKLAGLNPRRLGSPSGGLRPVSHRAWIKAVDWSQLGSTSGTRRRAWNNAWVVGGHAGSTSYGLRPAGLGRAQAGDR